MIDMIKESLTWVAANPLLMLVAGAVIADWNTRRKMVQENQAKKELREIEKQERNVSAKLDQIICEQTKANETDKILTIAMQDMLRNSIRTQHRTLMARKHMTYYDRDNINRMYESYKALGGNSTVTDMINELKALPTVEDVKKDNH